jgi:hypothetical protein
VDDETDDLLQDAILEALRADRTDLVQPENYRWVVGTLKKLGAMSARGGKPRSGEDGAHISTTGGNISSYPVRSPFSTELSS